MTDDVRSGDAPRPLPERQAIARDLREFDRLDRSQAGGLTGRSYGKVRHFDANRDGKVTREEFLAGRARERATERFQQLDRTGTGRLDVGGLKEKYRRYDTNQDGVVDEHEFVEGHLIDTQGLRDGMEFDRMDRSGDGFLSGQRTYKKFKRYDANQDGKISKEEFLAGRSDERALAKLKEIIDGYVSKVRTEAEG